MTRTHSSADLKKKMILYNLDCVHELIIVIGIIFPSSITWLKGAQEFSCVSRYKAIPGLEKEQ